MARVKYCRMCGAKMAHFENPSRYICPNTGNHNKTPEGANQQKLRDQPGASRKGEKRTGLQRWRMSLAAKKREAEKRKK